MIYKKLSKNRIYLKESFDFDFNEIGQEYNDDKKVNITEKDVCMLCNKNLEPAKILKQEYGISLPASVSSVTDFIDSVGPVTHGKNAIDNRDAAFYKRKKQMDVEILLGKNKF